MNRIILIGNGFDLAHGMATSYGNFIDDYWRNAIEEIRNKPYWENGFENDEFYIQLLPKIWEGSNDYEALEHNLHNIKSKIHFKNEFFDILNRHKSSLNWVDIENDYYSLLKNCYKKRSGYYIEQLNEEFSVIESLLEEYLTRVEKEFSKGFPRNDEEISFKRSICEIIYSDFNLRDFSETSINNLTEIEFQRVYSEIKSIEEGHISLSDNELSERDLRLYQVLINIQNKKQKIKELLTSEAANNYFRHRPKEILFVNFNYTSTEVYYDNPPIDSEFGRDISTDVVHIHGILNNKTDNKLIFGFGDEIDKDYLEIENLNDNEYLKNIKSMKYLENDSYKRLLEFINSNNYQVFIFGHSCGISDRTLLNTLFEHKNCSSVKPYYRKKNDGTDNYSEMIRNISRNFTDKASMRDKVVNKKYTQALFS
ncbi:AbiH family protein [Chryseobacterium sp. NRRL B-14798]|uniref:AbiH family protein n=1 Tax=Chryseobacterium sp. NRRL B-14798 TaxID=3162880 RepID=UPI003D1AAAED